MIDDTPIVPGDAHPAFAEVEAARQVLNDAESDLQGYRLDVEPITSNSGHLGVGAMPGTIPTATDVAEPSSTVNHAPSSRSVSGEEQRYAAPPYPVTESETTERQEPIQKEVSTAV